MTQSYTDPQTGRQYQEGPDGWVDVTPTPDQAAAAQMTPLEAFVKSAGNVVAGLGRGYVEGRAQAPGLSFAPSAPRALSEEDNRQIIAATRAQQLDADGAQAAISEAYPVAATAGAVLPYLGAAAIPAARGGVGRMMAAEGTISSIIGFMGRPGTLSERVKGAAMEGGLAAAGAGVLGAASRGVATGARVARETAEEIRGRITGEMTMELELEALTNTPRLGAAAQREYDRLASRAELPQGMDETQRNLALRAEQLGIALSSGRRTQNLQLLQWESGLARIPAYSRPFEVLKNQQQQRFNDLIAVALGQRRMSASGVGRALDDIGEGFERVANDLPEIELTPGLASRLDDIERETDTVIGAMQPVFENIRRLRAKFFEEGAQEGEEAVARAITGRQLMDARSQINNELRRLSSSAQSNSNGVIQTEKMLDLVDDMFEEAAERASRGDLVPEYQRLRDQWRLADMLDRHNLVEDTGNVSQKRFRNAARRRYVREYRRSDLTPASTRRTIRDALDASKVLNGLPDPIPDSGTPTGNFVQNFLADPISTTIKGAGGITIGRMAFEAQRAGGGRQLREQIAGGIGPPSRPAMVFGAGVGGASGRALDGEEE